MGQAAVRRSSSEPKRERTYLQVEDVGPVAVRLAAMARHDPSPRVLVGSRTLAMAPIDSHAAFLISLIDGMLSVVDLIDISGMPEREARAALERLARLGIIALE